MANNNKNNNKNNNSTQNADAPSDNKTEQDGAKSGKKPKHTLILMRHSKAEPASIIDDINRELTPIGRKKAKSAAKRLLKKDVLPDLVLSSTALRAFQTAEIVAGQINADADVNKIEKAVQLAEIEALYLAGAGEMLAEVRQLSDENKTVIIVAHEPTISQTAFNLCSMECASELRQELSLGISTANFVVLKSSHPFSQWEWGSINKVKIVHIE